jgi:hypothetical protein
LEVGGCEESAGGWGEAAAGFAATGWGKHGGGAGFGDEGADAGAGVVDADLLEAVLSSLAGVGWLVGSGGGVGGGDDGEVEVFVAARASPAGGRAGGGEAS